MLGNRLPKAGTRWAANLDDLVLPQGREIEGVFPDEWILQLYNERANWFDEIPTQDMEGSLIGFSIRENSKAQARNYLQRLGEAEPQKLVRLDSLLEAIEDALQRQAEKLDA